MASVSDNAVASSLFQTKAFPPFSCPGVVLREVNNTSDGIRSPCGDIPLELRHGTRVKHGVDSRE